MKIILSRKGFDSSSGGCPSPIYEDGSILSLPIAHSKASTQYADIQARGGSIGRVVEDLTRQRMKRGRYMQATDRAHLDPDLRRESLARKPGWRPLFGQVDAAQGHLDKHCVGVGDLFLFFGWFRGVQRRDGRYSFVRGAPDLHVLFGWLEIGDVWRGGSQPCRAPAWAARHPHVAGCPGHANTIYVASEGDPPHGGGVFPRFHPDLVLTAPGMSRGRWRLPGWFHPTDGRSALSFHSNPSRWSRHGQHAYLQTVGRGQEFVLDADGYPEAVPWARGLITAHGRPA